MSGLNIKSLSLMADGDEWQSLRKLDTDVLLNLQLAKAMYGYLRYLETLPHGRELWSSLLTALEQTDLKWPI